MDGLKLWVKTELQRRGVQDLSWAITVVKSLIEFEHVESPMSWNKGNSGGDWGSSSSFEKKNDEKPTDHKVSIEKTAKYKGKEKKPLSCYFFEDQHRVRECSMHKELAAIVRAVELSKGESNDDGQRQKEPNRMGAICSVKEQHHEEPKKVLRLGAIRHCNGEKSFKRADKGENVAIGSHNLSPKV